MHLFDIRRSNSVTELWKRFEYSQGNQATEERGTGETVAQSSSSQEEEAASNSGNADTSSSGNDGSQTLLEAFEAEMAKLLNNPEAQDEQPPRQSASAPAGAQPEPTNSGSIPNPTVAFAQAIHNIVDGAEMVRDEVRSRIPDFERQLQNAQRALPEQVGTTLQAALTTLESHVRNLASVLNNISVPTGQAEPNSQPPPFPGTHTVDGLRIMASELGQMGQTLFTAFEHEFGRLPSIGSNPTPSEAVPDPVNTNNQEQTSTAVPTTSGGANPPVGVRDSSSNNPSENEKETLASNSADGTKSTTQSNEATGERNTTTYRPYDNLNFSPTHRFNPHPLTNRLNSTRSNGATREITANPYGPYDNMMRQQQHNIGLPPPASAGRANSTLASNAYQRPPVNFPFRHPSHHHHQPFYHRRVPGHFSQNMPPANYSHMPTPRMAPPVFYGPPVSAVPPTYIPPSVSSIQPTHMASPYSRPPHSGVSHGNADSEMWMRNTNHSSRKKHESQTGRNASKTLFVGNVGFSVSESMIRTVFASKGFLVDVHLPLDSRTRKHAGFGYLQFPSIEAAKAALDALQGTHIDGHAINLEFSDNPPITSLHTSHNDHQASSQAHPSPSPESNLKNPNSVRPSLVNTSAQTANDLSLKDQSNKGKERASSEHEESLALNEPCSSSKDAAGPERSNSSAGISLLDQDNGEFDFATRYPSLLSNRSADSSRFDSTHDNLVHLSPELEMSRFPPVSQVEAHTLAKRDEMKATAASSKPETNANEKKDIHRGYPTIPAAPKPSLQDHHANFDMSDPSKQNSLEHGHRGLRRSNTMMPVNPSARLTGPFDPLSPVESGGPSRPLRRAATQRQSLRRPNFEIKEHPHHRGFPANPSNESKRQSNHSESRYDINRFTLPVGTLPGTRTSAPSEPNNAVQSRVDDRQRAIDDCVATLFKLGYGGARDGGRSRIIMYAEVAGGNVLEAIEMIEEERKAYEQRQPRM